MEFESLEETYKKEFGKDMKRLSKEERAELQTIINAAKLDIDAFDKQLQQLKDESHKENRK